MGCYFFFAFFFLDTNKPLFSTELEYGAVLFILFLGGFCLFLWKELRRLKENYQKLEKDLLRRDRELSRAKDELKTTSEELSDFVYLSSHDLKAPLRGILSLATWIEEEQELQGEAKKFMELLKKRVLRLENFLQGILDFFQVENVSEETSEWVPLQHLVPKIIAVLKEKYDFEIECPSDLPQIQGLRLQLEQLFFHLLQNAILHNDKEKIWIKIAWSEKEEDSVYEFEVFDNGPGIEKPYQERVFEVFKTLKSRDEFDTTGLGLALAKRIVEKNKGKIWIEDHLEDQKGLMVKLQWPIPYLPGVSKEKLR